MARLLDDLKKCSHDWLVADHSDRFFPLAQQLYSELTALLQQGIPPKILLVERDPVRFLAGFIAACAAGCPVFLGNSNWGQQEWQQVFALVQPDLILGYGNWGLAIREYRPIPELSLLNKCCIERLYPDSSLIMIPTGGSSGNIRFAIHSWETLTASVQGFQQYFQLSQINSFCVLPLYHVSGLMQFLRCFTTGGKLVIQPFKAVEGGEKYEINLSDCFISLVPTQLQRLLQNPDLADWLAQFSTVLLGGAPAWQELLTQARSYGIRLAPTYGMTETASQIATLKPTDFLEGYSNSGRVLPHAKVTIRNQKNEILGINQVGNITIEAKSLALGYYPKLFSSQKQFQLDDLGFFDEQGYLNIVGRSGYKIITGGENVHPYEVEAAIRETQMVADICVIGLLDNYWGQVVTAVYVPYNSSVTTTEIKDAIAGKLCKFKQPKHWLSLPSLPRNSQGKINYKYLHQIATELLQNSSK